MNTLIRIISVILLSLAFSASVFASSGDTSDTPSRTGSVQSEDTDSESNAKDEKKEKIKQEVSSYIIESYKAQWDKIIKDIDQTLQKNVPNIEDRIEAYDKIQKTLEARRKLNKSSTKISDTSKQIIDAFLTHMIDSIEKKKRELKE